MTEVLLRNLKTATIHRNAKEAALRKKPVKKNRLEANETKRSDEVKNGATAAEEVRVGVKEVVLAIEVDKGPDLLRRDRDRVPGDDMTDAGKTGPVKEVELLIIISLLES